MFALTAFAVFAACGAEIVDGVEMLPSHFDGKTPVVVETEAFRHRVAAGDLAVFEITDHIR